MQVNNGLQAAGPGVPRHEDRREWAGGRRGGRDWDGWNRGCVWGPGGRCNWTDASRWGGGVKQVKESGLDPEGNEQPGRS